LFLVTDATCFICREHALHAKGDLWVTATKSFGA
jgi:hypothetical protein